MAEALRKVDVVRPALRADELDVLSYWLGESGSLQAWRREALERYQSTESPARWRHLWKYTPPATLFPSAAVLPAAHEYDEPEELAPSEGALVTLAPGAKARISVGAGLRAKGVRIMPLAEAGAALEELAGYGRLGELLGPAHGLFEALNGAAWSSGVLVHVPQGRKLSEPVILRLSAVAGQTSVPRVLVIVEPRASLSLLEQHEGGGPEASVLSVTELFVDQAAELKHTLVQSWAPGTTGHLSTRGAVGRDASLDTVVVSLGGERAKLDLGALLVEPGGRSDLRGVVLADGTQHMDHHTVHEHRAPNTWSKIDLKVVLGGEARSAYTGLIRIAEGAAGAQAYQENRNLLLSEGARADTIPELEILTDEVACTHGATVAPMDKEQLFYLQSRGLTPRAALSLILEGFFTQSVERLPEALQQRVLEQVARRLEAVAARAL